MPASQVLTLSRPLGASIESWMLKLWPWKVFILYNFFSGCLFGCHWSFPINSFPLSSPWLPLYSSPPQHGLPRAHTLNTHTLKTHKYSPLSTLQPCPQRGHPQGCSGCLVEWVLHDELWCSPLHSNSVYFKGTHLVKVINLTTDHIHPSW